MQQERSNGKYAKKIRAQQGKYAEKLRARQERSRASEAGYGGARQKYTVLGSGIDASISRRVALETADGPANRSGHLPKPAGTFHGCDNKKQGCGLTHKSETQLMKKAIYLVLHKPKYYLGC